MPKSGWEHILLRLTTMLINLSIGRFVVRVAELAEAEGRLAKQQVLRLLKTSLFCLVAAVLALAGIGVVAVGGIIRLADVIGLGNAFLSIGGTLLLLALALGLVIGRREGK